MWPTLTVDGCIATGGAVAAVLIIGGCNAWVALVAAFLVGMLAGLVTGCSTRAWAFRPFWRAF